MDIGGTSELSTDQSRLKASVPGWRSPELNLGIFALYLLANQPTKCAPQRFSRVEEHLVVVRIIVEINNLYTEKNRFVNSDHAPVR